MSDLTEGDCWRVLRENLRQAIQNCDDLANLPAQGPSYWLIRKNLGLIEGAARQVGTFRSDMRWHAFGYEMQRFHDRIGDAIRAHSAREIFAHMAQMMRGALAEADKLHTAKTGRRGPILPKARPQHRENRPVYVRSEGGVMLPA